ncbi:MAG TPA: hypothetical protein VM100_07930, partial [Longimicrobiales bacterium]|nr:hypothetical protein [Longimicrobiales bacterium]
ERELHFNPGDCYDPFLLQETERLLRAYDFLAQVDVFGIPQPDGSYHVVVDTRDQWSTSLDLRIGFDRGFYIDGMRLRETNLLGRGQEIAFSYRNREVTRDYGVTFGTRQFGGTRWDLRTAFGKTRAGSFVDQTVTYPFVGEVGRYAARQSFTREDQFFDYIFDTPERPSQHILVPVRQKTFDVGIGARLGHRGNLTVIGAMLTYQELTFPGQPELADQGDFDERVPVDSALQRQLLIQREPLGNVRLGAVFGQRNVWWVKKRGYDAMRGQQDVPLGADVTLAIARSLAALERNNDLAATFKLYAGIEAGLALFTTRVRVDARRDFEAAASAHEWEDVYGEAESLNYLRPTARGRHTLLFRAAAAGAWNTTTPFQLTLGGERNLRGYRYDRFPGGRRAVFNLEDRIYFGWPLPDVMDLGATIFADVGRIWPGDVPFGRDSGWRKTIGAGLRGSFPANSRTSFRLDFATALEGGFSWRGVRMILSASEILGLGAGDSPDTQLLRSRNEGLAGELFRSTNR